MLSGKKVYGAVKVFVACAGTMFMMSGRGTCGRRNPV